MAPPTPRKDSSTSFSDLLTFHENSGQLENTGVSKPVAQDIVEVKAKVIEVCESSTIELLVRGSEEMKEVEGESSDSEENKTLCVPKKKKIVYSATPRAERPYFLRSNQKDFPTDNFDIAVRDLSDMLEASGFDVAFDENFDLNAATIAAVVAHHKIEEFQAECVSSWKAEYCKKEEVVI